MMMFVMPGIIGIFGRKITDKEHIMKIAVLGSTGMLGSVVGKYLIEKFGEDNIHLSYRQRSQGVAYGKNQFYFDATIKCIPELCNIASNLSECDYVINCIGIIKPYVNCTSIPELVRVNSVFPWELSNFCKHKGIKLIHITTDCVFSGLTGNYDENSPHDALDEYGKTKSLGEPKNCMVLRTSIIGEELHSKSSLVEWVKSQAGGDANGYTNHLWNGVTIKEYAKICDRIIKQDLYAEDLYHVFSPNDINKCELLDRINRRFELNIDISPVEAPIRINRCLRTVKDLNCKLHTPCVSYQIMEM